MKQVTRHTVLETWLALFPVTDSEFSFLETLVKPFYQKGISLLTPGCDYFPSSMK